MIHLGKSKYFLFFSHHCLKYVMLKALLEPLPMVVLILQLPSSVLLRAKTFLENTESSKLTTDVE